MLQMLTKTIPVPNILSSLSYMTCTSIIPLKIKTNWKSDGNTEAMTQHFIYLQTWTSFSLFRSRRGVIGIRIIKYNVKVMHPVCSHSHEIDEC